MSRACVCDITGAVSTGAEKRYAYVPVTDKVRLVVQVQTRTDPKSENWQEGHLSDVVDQSLVEALMPVLAKLLAKASGK